MTEPAPLQITRRILTEIEGHVIASYPEEACGVLLGRDLVFYGERRRVIIKAQPLANAWPGDRSHHFLIPASTIRDIEAEARGRGLELIGTYHSHPEREAYPSEFDLEAAWPWYTYLIIGVQRSLGEEPDEERESFSIVSVRAWQMKEDRTGFLEQEIRIR